MTRVSPPPIYEPVVNADDLKATLPWTLFANSIYSGDTGTDWVPNFVNLTTVGTPTITGRFFRIGQTLCYFSIRIVPTTNTSSTPGSTYIDNIPAAPKNDGICFAVSGNLGTESGMVDAASGRIYVPGWSAVTIPLTVVGMCEIQ